MRNKKIEPFRTMQRNSESRKQQQDNITANTIGHCKYFVLSSAVYE